MPNEETLMQKVITIDQLEKYLTGEVDLEIGGYVSRAQDVIDLKTYDNIREGLRLDYTFDGGFSPFPEGGNEYAIIRFKTDTVIEIPRTKEFNGNEKIWSNEYGRQPFTGNGFTKSNDTIIPEFILSDKKAPIEAEFYKIIDGELNLVATYSDGEFILIK
ncbi:hypothetical protein [Rubeoparvulum massiliense]|uniref:hypothetical protein n=1 Tax=Rubeoparvulum massiliense TaxID=1631346 RepID=UPI00065DE47F|nr:hypothetical protein [Rubeoparvulum massiliense]